MNKFKFDKQSFIINGERKFLISGEFQYYRVPKHDWERRLDIFIEGGGNCIASYVPWVVHEPNEGEILFDDCDERSLTDFLELLKRKKLFVVLRPGPYVYSELINSGLPTWLVRNYPELHAKTIDGVDFKEESCSYLHPLFLEYTKKWYKEFSRVIYPYILENGGPVVMVQLDNETIGVHEWWGSIDYNPVTMGFGKEDGRYPIYLQKKYCNIDSLNEAYGATYSNFMEVHPKTQSSSPIECARVIKDYQDFYYETVAEYLLVLKSFLIENGINTLFCHNSANPNYISMMKSMNNKLGEDFLLGVDNYYSLNINWGQTHPTPDYFIKTLYAADQLSILGNPMTVLELPGGSPSDFPPILNEDLYTAYMVNLAAGMKGLNYYIYTGGKNVYETGIFSDDYDFNAFISPKGDIRDTFNAFEMFNTFLNNNQWLSSAERISSVQIGVEWQTLRGNEYAFKAKCFNTVNAQRHTEKCVLYSLLSSKYSGMYVELTDKLDVNKPLIICSPDNMSKKAQENLIDFLKNGGKLLILTTFPTLDEDFNNCTILKDFVGDFKYEKNDSTSYVNLINGERIYRIDCENKIVDLPNDSFVFATDASGNNILGFRKNIGLGEVVHLSGNWLTADYKQIEMFEKIVESIGAKSYVENSNRSIWATMFESENEKCIFLLNLYTGVQTTHTKIYDNDEVINLGEISLNPLEIKFIKIK